MNDPWADTLPPYEAPPPTFPPAQRRAQRSEAGKGPGKRAKRDQAPLRREWVDDSIIPLRLLGGITLVSYSAIATIRGVEDDARPWLQNATLYSIPQGILAGIVVAVLIFVLQVVFGERSRMGYYLVLAPDAWYTGKQLWPGVKALVTGGADSLPFLFLAVLVSGALALAIARYGEILLFGKRRMSQA